MNYLDHLKTSVGLRTAAILLVLLASRGQAQLRAKAEPTGAEKSDVKLEDTSIRPFRVHIPEEKLVDLRQRLAATRLPEQETAADQSQGVQLATIKELMRYWQTDYDWRKVETRLNALPQFVTTIDGEEVYFIHVRSKHPNAMPLIMTHGWPGSVIELLNVIDPLTNPTAHGGRAEDAFDMVIPSMPGLPRLDSTRFRAS